MFNLDPVRSLCPAEIMRAGMKAKRRIFAKNRMAWPLVGFAFFAWSTQFKSGPPLSNNKCLIRKARCFLAVDAGTVLLDKKTPTEEVLEGCFEPGLTKWGPCWSFRRFGLADAAHRSKEGSPFRKC
jgi:hypothetical protein